MKDLSKNDHENDDIFEGNGLPDELVADMMMEFCEISIPQFLEYFTELCEDQKRLKDEIMAFLCFLCEAFAISNLNDGDYIRYRFIKQFSPKLKKSIFSRFITNRVEMYHEAHIEKKCLGIWDVNGKYSSDNFIFLAITILGDMIYYPDSKSITTYDEYINSNFPIRDFEFQFKIQQQFFIFMLFRFKELIKCLEVIVEPIDTTSTDNDDSFEHDDYDDD